MFSQLEFLIASRYLRSKRSEGFISIIAGFSLVGIILGVATLIIVMSVMNGFRTELVDRILAHDIPLPVTVKADYAITQLEITKKFIKKYLNPNTGKLFYNVSDIKSKPNNTSRKAELDEYLKIQKENENKNVNVNSSGYSKTN